MKNMLTQKKQSLKYKTRKKEVGKDTQDPVLSASP